MTESGEKRFLYFACLVIVNLLWAAQYPAYKIASDHMGAATLNFWTLTLSSLLLMPFVVRQRRSIPRKAHAWLQFVVLGVLGIVPASVFLAWGVAHSTSSNAAILSMTIPVLMSTLGIVMLHEKVTVIRVLSLLLALAGTVLISQNDLHSGSFSRTLLIGNSVIFLAGAGSAFYNAYSKKLLDRFSEPEVLLYGYLTAVAACAVIAVFSGEPPLYRVREYPLSAWLAVALLGGLPWGFAMILWMWVLKRIQVSQASVSIYLLSVFGVLLSAVTLHERIGLGQLLGGGFVVVATVLATEFDHRLNIRKKGALADGFQN